MEKKVVHEIRLSKPVMTVAVMAAVGLLAIGAKPLIEATPAFASGNITKVAICDRSYTHRCADITKYSSSLKVSND